MDSPSEGPYAIIGPMTAEAALDSRFRCSEAVAAELAATYGTPLYVVDESHFRARIREYLSAFRAVAPGGEISFASKANSALAVLAIAAREGCSIDVASEGELRAALAAGVPASRCHLHGNNKSRRELEFAFEEGVSHIVVDHFDEIETISELAASRPCPSLVLRLAPGVDPVTHAKISTGQADTKFGFNIADGSAEKATRRSLALGLPLIGFHCHVGSQLLDPEAQRAGGELIARFAAEMSARHGFKAVYLNVGGGLGVRYTDADRPTAVGKYCRLVVDGVRAGLNDPTWEPALAQEPGRSLIGESGVTLYRVGVVKTVPAPGRGSRTYACVDGGLADNPRPALYGSRYQVERVVKGEQKTPPAASGDWLENADRSETLQTVGPEVCEYTISGRHCETDKLFEDVSLPADLNAGDLLQVLCTGAYNSSMASNYNRYPRPGTVLLRSDGTHAVIQRPDAWDEMLAREILPKDLGN